MQSKIFTHGIITRTISARKTQQSLYIINNLPALILLGNHKIGEKIHTHKLVKNHSTMSYMNFNISGLIKLIDRIGRVKKELL